MAPLKPCAVRAFRCMCSTTPPPKPRTACFPTTGSLPMPAATLRFIRCLRKNRRKERRWDVIELLKREYRVQDVIDYSGLEQDGLVAGRHRRHGAGPHRPHCLHREIQPRRPCAAGTRCSVLISTLNPWCSKPKMKRAATCITPMF